VLKKDPYVVVDGAHNPDAACKLKQSIELYFKEQEKIFIMGMFRDKQYDQVAEILTPMAKQIYTITPPDEKRGLCAEDMAQVVEHYNPQVQPCKTLKEAVEKGIAQAGEYGVVVAYGSLSFIGEITKIITGEDEDD
jgi:dihydrofolate synthase/folylpolyglutamate synthase